MMSSRHQEKGEDIPYGGDGILAASFDYGRVNIKRQLARQIGIATNE